MQVYIHTYIHTDTHPGGRMQADIHPYTHRLITGARPAARRTTMHMYRHTPWFFTQPSVHTYPQAYRHTDIQACILIHTYIQAYIPPNIHTRVPTHIHAHKHTCTDTGTNTQTHTQMQA